MKETGIDYDEETLKNLTGSSLEFKPSRLNVGLA
jgi:hypothetical protein